MPKFQTKRVVIEAIQFTGKNGAEVKAWVMDRSPKGEQWFVTKGMTAATSNQAWNYVRQDQTWPEGAYAAVYVYMSERWVPVWAGEWIIHGTEGEFYPCKDSVFRFRYEEI